MTQADTGAVYIGYLPIQTQFLFTTEVLGRECLVQFNQLKILYLDVRIFLQEIFNCRDRAQTHHRGMTGPSPCGPYSRNRLETQLFGLISRHDDHGAGPIVDA